MSMKHINLSAINNFRLFLLIVLITSLSSQLSQASTVSETFIFLKENGQDYLLQRSMRTLNTKYDFYVDKKIGQDSFYYIDPNQYEWDDSKADINRLKFNTGNFVVMYPKRLDSDVTIDDHGVFTFNSWDGKKQKNGHFGIWNEPDNFSRFTYAWFFPETMEIIDYSSNQKGEWIIRNNALSFYAKDINDITFTIRYRDKDSDKDGVVDRYDSCPDSRIGSKVDSVGCEINSDSDSVADSKDQYPDMHADVNNNDCKVDSGKSYNANIMAQDHAISENIVSNEIDSDQDGVIDSIDQCPNTFAGANINANGCETDADNDGIRGSIDQCPNTPAGVRVNNKGCEIDTDKDGVRDSIDQCPNTSANARVNNKGCAIDTDKDGVIDSMDQCPNTFAGANINANGCEIDSDNDAVINSKDQCPNTPAGARVNNKGCEIDTDRDGILGLKDQCPNTPVAVKVNNKGCEIDTDNDGIVDSKDQCLNTPASAAVNDKGCEIDFDNDGIVNSKDHCPNTFAGTIINDNGCEIDSDNDGIVNSKDQCINTPAGTQVNKKGCEIDADHDGIQDIYDLCPGTAADTDVDYTGCRKFKPIVLKGVNFHTDSAKLITGAKSILDDVAVSLISHGNIKLEIAGHTDSIANDLFNLKLSRERAKSVFNYLVNKGVDAATLSTVGYGESQPITNNDTPASRAINRRVELNRISE